MVICCLPFASWQKVGHKALGIEGRPSVWCPQCRCRVWQDLRGNKAQEMGIICTSERSTSIPLRRRRKKMNKSHRNSYLNNSPLVHLLLRLFRTKDQEGIYKTKDSTNTESKIKQTWFRVQALAPRRWTSTCKGSKVILCHKRMAPDSYQAR